MSLPGTLICTIGTSLFSSNLSRLDPDTAYQNKPPETDRQSTADWEALKRNGLLDDKDSLKKLMGEIKQAYVEKMFPRIGLSLVGLPPELRLLGAEINSIEAMVRKGFLTDALHRLILLVSDTEDGAAIGNILRKYFLEPKCPIRFDQCQIETVEGLQDEQPLVFQTKGLPNLVRLLGDHYRKWGGSSSIAINATGGYKAQIALAVAFGQATKTPVYYKHERFDQVIRFPRIPFTLDLSFVEEHLKLWADLAEQGAYFNHEDIDKMLYAAYGLQDLMMPLLDSLGEGSEVEYCLSALGQVYWEAFLALKPGITLEPAKANVRRGCHFRDDHYPIGFKQHVKKFYNDFPEYVTECHSLKYSGQAAIKDRFYVKGNEIIGEYKDKNSFGARFAVMTSTENRLERDWLIELFNKWL